MEMDRQIPSTGVIKGHQECQTKDAKWLCIENLYHKLHRPNLHDIGGTHVNGVADFWFLSKTERAGQLYLLHILITSRQESTFDISISSDSEILINDKLNVAFLNQKLKNFEMNVELKMEGMSINHVTTFSFTEFEISFFQTRNLYIPIRFYYKNNKDKWDSQITHNFESLLRDPVGADFTIESLDGFKYPVHKALLSAVSEVFKAMLKEDTAESQNSYLKLVDVNKEDLLCILEFIYSGTVNNIENINFFNILMLADRYDLKDLKELSEIALSSQLSLDNAIESLAVADMYNSQRLKRAAFHYIKANPIAIHSTTFKELKNAEILQELCKFIAPTS